MPSFFVSSTFRDMHLERDVLHKQVFPVLEERAKQCGDHVNICDLRWGIDTDELNEQESMHKILSVCLDNIDRCGDYFIAFIGSRYGFIPEEKYLQEVKDNYNLSFLPEVPISVTELEILYALRQLKNQGDYRHIVFYVREIKGKSSARYESESEMAANRIQLLKDKLHGIPGLNIKSYCLIWDEEKDKPTDESLIAFADMIRDDLKNMLEVDWNMKERYSGFELDRRIHRGYALRKSKDVYLRESLVQKCIGLIERRAVSAIKGPIGIGKSTLMSQLAVIMSDRNNLCDILFSGYTPLMGTAEELLQHMLVSLSDRLKSIYDTKIAVNMLNIPQKLALLDEWLLLYESHLEKENKHYYIFIDAVDQLIPDELRDNLFFITDTFAECKNIHIVISAVDSFHIPDRIPTIEIHELNREEIISISEKIAGMEFKELNSYVQNSILAQEMSKNPLYLSLLIKRLFLMDQDDFKAIEALEKVSNPISAYQGALISQLDEALFGICRQITDFVADRIGGKMVQKCLSYLAVSRYGLTESQLERLFQKHNLQFCYADFALFIRYLDIFFIRRMDGKIDFSHKSLRIGILEQYMDNEEYLLSMNNELAELFSEESEGRSNDEMYWHLLEASDFESFYKNLNAIKKNDSQCVHMAAIVKMWLLLGHNEKDLLRYPVRNLSVDMFNDVAVFINHHVRFQLKSSRQEQKLALSLEQTLYEIGNKIAEMGLECDINSNEHYLRNMMIIRNVLAEIISKERTEEASWKAIEYLEMNLSYLETVPTDSKLRFEGLYKDRITVYERLSDLYGYMDGKENLKKAHTYLIMAVKTAQAYVKCLENGDSLATMLSIYLRMTKLSERISDLDISMTIDSKEDNGIDYYDKSLVVIEKLVHIANQCDERDKEYIDILNAIAFGYDAISEYYYQLRDQQHLNMAKDLCIKAIEIGKNISRLQGDITFKTIQGASYLRLASIYEELDMNLQEKNKRIEQNLQRGCYIYKSLMEELGNFDAMRDYAVSLGRIVMHYSDLSDDSSRQKGIMYAEECLKIYEALIKKMPSLSLLDEAAKEMCIKADFLISVYTKSSLIGAYNVYKKALRLQKRIYQELKSNASLREIAFIHGKLAEILLEIDDEYYAKQAMQHLHKVLKILSKIAKSGESMDNLNDFLNAYELLSRCYRAIKLNDRTFTCAVRSQKEYIRKCQKYKKIDPCEDSVFNLSAAYENLADLHFHKKGVFHLYMAEKYAKISYNIFKEYEKMCGVDQCKGEWIVFYNHIGAIYLERYGFEKKLKYLKKSYIFLRKALHLNKGIDQEEYLISIKNLAEHPFTSSEKRRKYLKKSYCMAKKRYQETQLEWYRVMMTDIKTIARKL